MRRQLKNGTYVLLQEGIIENSFADGFSETDSYRLTDKAKEEFLDNVDDLLVQAPLKGLKLHTSISSKNLFYPLKTQYAIDELAALLKKDNFDSVQKRLCTQYANRLCLSFFRKSRHRENRNCFSNSSYLRARHHAN